jgi:hypothetical protein
VAPLVIGTDESQGKQPLHVLTAATFYHLVRDTATVESPAVEVPRRDARLVQAVLDPRSPPLAAPPRLEVEWQPAQVVFVARGEGPYRLAFGKRDARAEALTVQQLIPGYQAYDEMKLAAALVGGVRAAAPEEPAWKAMLGDTSPRKAALWAILVAAVALLAWMAIRLGRQMKEPAKDE